MTPVDDMTDRQLAQEARAAYELFKAYHAVLAQRGYTVSNEHCYFPETIEWTKAVTI